MPIDARSCLSKGLPVFFTSLYVLAVTFGAFNGGLWASLGIGGSLLVYLGVWKIQRKMPLLDHDLNVFTFGSLGIVALLNLHSYDPVVSWHIWLQEITIMVPLLLLFSENIADCVYSPHFLPCVTLAALMGAVALGVELCLDAPLLHWLKGNLVPLTRYNRGASYLAVMALPLLGYLWINKYRIAAFAFVVLMFLPFGLTESRATKVAFMAALGVVVLSSLYPRMTRWGLTLFLFLLLSMPVAAPYAYLHYRDWLIHHLPPSWYNRVEIWDYMSYRIYERPWLGWGIGGSRIMPYASPNSGSYVYVTYPPDHPHNVILHLWVELGFPGIMIGVFFALWMLKKASAFPRSLVPFAYGAWMAALCISLTAYNFWDDSQFAMFAMVALNLKLLANNTPPSRVGCSFTDPRGRL